MEQNEPTTGEIVRALIESYDEREHGTATEAYKSIVIRALTDQQRQIAELTARAESAERERDAAIADLKFLDRCKTCFHAKTRHLIGSECKTCKALSNFKWRGAREGEKA